MDMTHRDVGHRIRDGDIDLGLGTSILGPSVDFGPYQSPIDDRRGPVASEK